MKIPTFGLTQFRRAFRKCYIYLFSTISYSTKFSIYDAYLNTFSPFGPQYRHRSSEHRITREHMACIQNTLVLVLSLAVARRVVGNASFLYERGLSHGSYFIHSVVPCTFEPDHWVDCLRYRIDECEDGSPESKAREEDRPTQATSSQEKWPKG